MDTITFRYASRFGNRYLEHFISILSMTVLFLCVALVLRWLSHDFSQLTTSLITCFVLSCLFEILASYGKTTIDLDKRLVKYSPAKIFPATLISIDDIDTIAYRKQWFYHNNVKITTQAGKKTFKTSVDDPKRFTELLTTENPKIKHNL